MRRLLALALLSAPLFSGCLYTHIKTPLDIDLDRTQLGSKVGRSEWRSVLWVAAWGDAGTQAAARQGGLSVINHADTELFVVLLGVYSVQTTILYGD